MAADLNCASARSAEQREQGTHALASVHAGAEEWKFQYSDQDEHQPARTTSGTQSLRVLALRGIIDAFGASPGAGFSSWSLQRYPPSSRCKGVNRSRDPAKPENCGTTVISDLGGQTAAAVTAGRPECDPACIAPMNGWRRQSQPVHAS